MAAERNVEESTSALPIDLGDGLTLDGYTPEYESGFLDCMGRSFDCIPSAQRWRHLNFDNPEGPSLILLVRKGSRVVAGITHLRRRLVCFGRTYRISHGMDAMTDPDFRLRGLRRALTAAIQDSNARSDVDFVSGVSNDNVVASNLKYGRQVQVSGFPPIVVKPTRPASAFWRVLTTGLGSLFADTSARREFAAPPDCAAAGPLRLNEKEHQRVKRQLAEGKWNPPTFDHRHDSLFVRTAETAPVHFVSDAATLSWRYEQTADTGYLQRDIVRGSEVLASMVVRPATLRGVPFLMIMEFAWTKSAQAQAVRLLADAEQLARALRTHAISILAMPETRERTLVKAAGYRAVPELLVGKGLHLTVGPSSESSALDRRLVDGSNWTYSWGDGFVL